MQMVIPPTNYTFDASEKTITLSDPYTAIPIERILSIRNLTNNMLIYHSEIPTKHVITIDSEAQDVIHYNYDGAMEDTDKIQIIIDSTGSSFGGLVVAASDSLAASKEQAHYVCTGTNDETVIQAAINSLPASGGKILLLEGTYIKGNAAGISIPSNVEIELLNSATITLANSINSNASIFTNSDSTNGNSNIIIHGGTLEGNEENQTSGSMYGINFSNVANSKIDCWIKGFRSYDTKLDNCSGVILENRWFGKKWNGTQLIYDGLYTITGGGSLTINLSSPVDLRNKKITFTCNHYYVNVFVTPTNGTEFYFSTFTDIGFPVIDRATPGDFYRLECASDLTSESSENASALKSISSIRFAFWTATSYQVGQVILEPLPEKPLVSISFDDGGAEFLDNFAPILEKYGWRGIVAYSSTYGDNLSKIQTLHNSYMWDVISHTYTHQELPTLTDEQAMQEFVWSRRFLENNGISRASHILAAPAHKINDAKYRLALKVYQDIRGVSRYNQAANLKSPWIQNYVITQAESLFRAKRTHSWEHMLFHRINTTADVENFCALLNSYGIEVVTFSDIYGKYGFANWENNKSIQNAGTATITTSGTSVDISHGLAATPARVMISPTTATGGKSYYVSAKTATTFTITIDSAHASDISFDWQATI